MSKSRFDKKEKDNNNGISYAKWLGFGLVGGGVLKVIESMTTPTEQPSAEQTTGVKKLGTR